MNSNLIHNILNVLIVLTAAASAFLSAYGCITLPNGAFDCSASTISPQLTGTIISVLGAVKLLINIARDGFSGLVKKNP